MNLRDIATAANDLAALLEKATTDRKGLRHPKHAVSIKPARAEIKRVMVHFFERQRRAVLAAVKPKIKRELVLYPVVESESQLARDYEGGRNALNSHLVLARESSPQGKTFARALMPTSLHPLSFSATAGETSDYNEAITELIGAAAKSLGGVIGPDFAGEYLAKNSLSKLTGEINNTSIERLQDALANSWDAGGSFDQMVDAIQSTFEDFSTTRAELIAQNEAASAYNSARQSIAESLGLDEKSSEVESDNPCEDCIDNEDAKWIDSDDDFPNGGDAPPFHVNCECVVNFRKTTASEDEEE